jgi:DNA-binding response OmpR family regulator/Tfp pilus assembly protein PilZ
LVEVRRADERVVDAVPVELLGRRGMVVRGLSQDISTGGLFVRTETLLPIGTAVELLLHVNEPPLRLAARVVHALTPAEARSLGRIPGMGLRFVDLGDLGDNRREAIRRHLDGRDTFRSQALSRHENNRVVVADGETRLLGRISTALGRAGFTIETATNGMEAYAAVLAYSPVVVITALHMAVMDGMALLRALGDRAELAVIPVIVMSEDAGDLRRLEVFQNGAMDFIPKPFTASELCIRTLRVAAVRHQSRRVVLRGELSKVGLANLLTMFATEQRSGILAVTSGEEAAWLSFRAGRLTKVRALDEGDRTSIDTAMRVLSWQEGHFEFTACEVDEEDEIGMGTTHLLLEHARVEDERRRRA